MLEIIVRYSSWGYNDYITYRYSDFSDLYESALVGPEFVISKKEKDYLKLVNVSKQQQIDE